MKIDIGVVYHKEAPIFQSEVLLPIQVGKARSDIDLGIQGDDIGDNLSVKNIWYGELSGTYWLWKNSKADIKGLFHYRRLLNLNENFATELPYYEAELEDVGDPKRFLSDLDLTKDRISSLLKKRSIIARIREDFRRWSSFTMESHFRANHISKHLDITFDILREDFPKIYPIAQKTLKDYYFYATNMVIMKSADFDDYCKFVFGVLEKLETKVNPYDREIENGGQLKKRYTDMIGERLTSIYIEYRKSLGDSVAEFPAVVIVPRGKRFWDASTYSGDAYAKQKNVKIIIDNFNDPTAPKASVIIAAYNVEKTIEKAIASVTNQTLSNIEIIIVNDGSTDNTSYKLESLTKTDERILIITQNNMGPGAARNAGLRVARGEYIHFMDGDDYIDLDFLETLVLNADRYKSDIVISGHKTVEENSGKIIGNSYLPHTLYGGNLNIHTHPDLMLVPGHLWDKIFRAKKIKEALFPNDKCNGEDILFWFKSLSRACTISICDVRKYNYMISNSSIQKRTEYALGTFNNMAIAQEFIKPLLNEEQTQLFYLIKRAVVAHMIHRARITMISNSAFRKQFFAKAKISLRDGKINFDETLKKKAMFFYINFEAVEKIAQGASLAELSRIFSLYFSFAKFSKYWALSKICFGRARKRYKAKYKSYKTAIQNFAKENGKARLLLFGTSVVKLIAKNNYRKVYVVGVPIFKIKYERNLIKYYIFGIKFMTKSKIYARLFGIIVASRLERYLTQSFDYIGWKISDLIPRKLDEIRDDINTLSGSESLKTNALS
jgi:glycosyltransferase involved in cell wall biosynthesis